MRKDLNSGLQVSGNLVSGLDEVTSKCKQREPGMLDKDRTLWISTHYMMIKMMICQKEVGQCRKKMLRGLRGNLMAMVVMMVMVMKRQPMKAMLI